MIWIEISKAAIIVACLMGLSFITGYFYHNTTPKM